MRSFRSHNHFFGFSILEELKRLGVQNVCIAPGSRSTPLVLGAEEAGLKTYVHHDERGLGYFALGLYKTTKLPVAIITTSGTAVSNLLPATTEAFHSDCPLILLTADRPYELHGVGANQAIGQTEIFKSVTAASLDLPPPGQDLPIESVLTALDEIYIRSIQNLKPVHINCQFREPLVPPHDGSLTITANAEKWIHSQKPYVNYLRPMTTHTEALDFKSARPLVMVGPGLTPQEEKHLQNWAIQHHLPVAVDVQSFLRGQGKCLRYTDWIIENLPQKPDALFWFGGVFQSKRVHRFLKNSLAPVYQFQKLAAETKREDDLHLQKTTYQIANISTLLDKFSITEVDSGWKEQLTQIDQKAQTFFLKQIDQNAATTEPSIARTTAASLPPNSFLMSGSSRPIRDLDSYAEGWPQLYANRGASGIDGNISTFAGLCEGSQQPGVLLLGDLATIHDLNGFGLIKKIKSPSAIVLVDNDGGGIFHFLTVHGSQTVPESVFEKYFGTPHGLPLDKIIEAFELPVIKAHSCKDLSIAISNALLSDGCKIIYLKSNRDKNLMEHSHLRQEWQKWFSSTVS